MPPPQKLINYIGVSKQSAKGSGASSPLTYGFGLLSGKVFETELSQDYEDETLAGGASDRFSPAVNRMAALPKIMGKTRAWKATIGLLALGVSGVTDTVTGTGPWSHAIVPSQAMNYFTFMGRYGTAERGKLVDAVFKSLGISWQGRAPLEVDFEAWALTPTYHQADFTVTNDETVNPYMVPIGGTLQLDTGSNTPAAGQVTGFSAQFDNNLDPVELSKSDLPDDFVPGEQTLEGTVTLKPNDFSDWLKIQTGTGTGTTHQSSPQYGSLSMLVQIDANSQLTIAANRVEFLAAFPDGDPKGGGMQLDLAYRVVRPTDGSAAYTVTVKNQTASY